MGVLRGPIELVGTVVGDPVQKRPQDRASGALHAPSGTALDPSERASRGRGAQRGSFPVLQLSTHDRRGRGLPYAHCPMCPEALKSAALIGSRQAARPRSAPRRSRARTVSLWARQGVARGRRGAPKSICAAAAAASRTSKADPYKRRHCALFPRARIAPSSAQAGASARTCWRTVQR